MIMSTIMSGLAVCLLAVFFGSHSYSGTQKTADAGPRDLADMRLENVRIKAQSIGQLFSSLSLSHNIPIGLEVALGDDETDTYDLDFREGTLSDLLAQFVARHDQYTWEIRDGVVNVFPKDGYRDVVLGELLGAEISDFTVKKETSCWALEDSLVTTPEIKRILTTHGITPRGRHFVGVYIPQVGREFTLNVSNLTLRSILNKVVKESPVAKSWLVKRYDSDGKFLISVNARHEGPPGGDGRPFIPQPNFPEVTEP